MPGANGQEKTKEELIISLKEAATDILELYRQIVSCLNCDLFDLYDCPDFDGFLITVNQLIKEITVQTIS